MSLQLYPGLKKTHVYNCIHEYVVFHDTKYMHVKYVSYLRSIPPKGQRIGAVSCKLCDSKISPARQVISSLSQWTLKKSHWPSKISVCLFLFVWGNERSRLFSVWMHEFSSLCVDYLYFWLGGESRKEPTLSEPWSNSHVHRCQHHYDNCKCYKLQSCININSKITVVMVIITITTTILNPTSSLAAPSTPNIYTSIGIKI